MSYLLLLPRCHSGPGCSYPQALATRLCSPLLPAAPKPTVVPVLPCWGLQGAGDGVIFLGALSHHWPEESLLSAALTPSSFACPSSGDLHGSRWQWWWLPGWQCPGGTASPASASDSKCFLFGDNGGPVVGRVAGGSVQSHRQPHVGCGTFLSGPGLSVAPAHPRGACVARGGAAARPCLWEAVATPLGGSAPRTPLSKTPSTLQRAPHPGKGLNPKCHPSKWWQCWHRGDAAG